MIMKPLTCGNVDPQSTQDQASDLRFFPTGVPSDIRVFLASLSPLTCGNENSSPLNFHSGLTTVRSGHGGDEVSGDVS